MVCGVGSSGVFIGSEAEVERLSDSVSRLSQQLERERESHASSTRSLHTSAEEGRSKVSRTFTS